SFSIQQLFPTNDLRLFRDLRDVAHDLRDLTRDVRDVARDVRDLGGHHRFDRLPEPARRPGYDPTRCYCPEPPPPCPAPNPLQVGADEKIHTPGGYTIEADGNTAWKITGPDGKCTTVSGDPHVSESDGGKWDFKRDSSFVLPDGTKI